MGPRSSTPWTCRMMKRRERWSRRRCNHSRACSAPRRSLLIPRWATPPAVTRIAGTVNAKGDQVGDRIWRTVTARFAPERAEVPGELLSLLGQQGGHDPGGSTCSIATTFSAGTPDPEEICRRVEERVKGQRHRVQGEIPPRTPTESTCWIGASHQTITPMAPPSSCFPVEPSPIAVTTTAARAKGGRMCGRSLAFALSLPRHSTATPNGASHGRGRMRP